MTEKDRPRLVFTTDIRRNIACVYPKADIGPDYCEVLEIVEEQVRETTGERL